MFETSTIECYRCQEIIAWLHGREQGRTVRCPICGKSYTRGKHSVLDEAGNLVSERWEESNRPAYCTKCNWTGPMRSTAYLEGNCFPFRCPMCSGIVANRKGEE